MAVKIASLVAELTAETASFHRDMGKAVSALNSHSAQMNRMIGGVDKMFRSLSFTMAAVAGPAAVGALIKANINLGDQLNKTSQKVGVSVEKLSAYQYAAKLSNVSNETLTASLARLGKAMAEGAADPTSKTAVAFRNLGVQLTDTQGKVRPLSDVFEEVARKLAKVPDGAVKVQYEMALLGRSGYEIAPLLNSLDELVDEAERTGRVVSTEFAQAAEIFNDELTRMQDALGLFLARSEQGPGILNGLTTALKSLQFVAMGAAQGFEELGTTIGAVGASSVAFATGNFSEARTILGQLDEDLKSIQKRGEEARAALFNETTPTRTPAAGAGAEAGGGAAALSPLATGSDQSAEKFMKSMRDLARATAESQAAMTQDEAAQSEARLMIARNEWFNKVEFSRLTTEQQQQFLTQFQEWNAAATEAQAQRDLEIQNAKVAQDLAEFERVAQSLMTEEEMIRVSYENRLFTIEDSYNKDLISYAKYEESKKKLQAQYDAQRNKQFMIGGKTRADFDKMTWGDQLSFMTGTLTDMTAAGASQSKRMFQINKAAAVANAVVSTAQGAAAALTWGFPLGPIFAAFIVASGLAQINAIRSAQYGSATSAPSVGGGNATPVTDVGATPQVPDMTSQQPASAPTTLQELPARRNVTIELRGEGMVSMEWVREVLMPEIEKAYDDGV